MAPVGNTPLQLAVLGGRPAFPPSAPVPLIYTLGYCPKGDFTAVYAIIGNEPNEDSKACASQQRFIAKILPGVGSLGTSYWVALQSRIQEFLKVDPDKTSVICVSSGTNALRAFLEVIVPQTTAGATVEAVIDKGFKPVFVEVTERFISDKTAAIVTVDWLGTQCDLGPFRKLADKHGIKLISDSAQSFGATNGQPPSIGLAHATIYSLGYPKVFTGAGSGGLIVCPKSLADLLERNPTGILRHEALAEVNAFMCLRALDTLPAALETRGEARKLYR
ncbi:pyridoxal phosphate-dependent transferase [Leptodontidium sp. 2 PMI_412]|nr:pyridoxal phosphate-dependent transferase [Leptodontidium sp. 2 PMI_412]